MRVPLLLSVFLLILTAVGCQGGSRADLQNKVDSLQTVNQNMAAQLELMRDSLRSGQSRSASGETTLTPPVYFPSGSAWLFDSAKQTLDQHAQTLKQRYPDAEFRIKGYTDNVPIGPSLKDTYPSNWYLSAQRAAAVAHYLDKEHGIRTRTLEIEAFGPKSPVAPNATAQGRRKNRRVEIVVEAR
jgi:chemotaxis protein MotB